MGEDDEVKNILSKAYEDFAGQGRAKGNMSPKTIMMSGRQFSKCMGDSKIIGGVKTTGTTKTDKVALHDDKSLHTGVYGREVEDEDGVSNASSLVDRDAKADARGVVGSKKKKGKGKGKKKKEEKEEEEEDDGIDLEDDEVKNILSKAYEDFAGQGRAKGNMSPKTIMMSGRQFSKCM